MRARAKLPVQNLQEIMSILVVLLLVSACAAHAAEDVVQLSDGLIQVKIFPTVIECLMMFCLTQGVVTERARSFRVVPYAAPPVGDLRWKVRSCLYCRERRINESEPCVCRWLTTSLGVCC